MKVRYKYGHTDSHEVLDESKDYYLIKLNGVQALPKADYVVVPTETWRDVTGECVFSPDHVQGEEEGRILHKRPGGGDVVVIGHGPTIMWDGYRLRKVENLYNDLHQTYFIVERKETT